MGTALITGGTIGAVLDVSTDLISRGDKVIIFHEFPGTSAGKMPEGAEMVFKLDPAGLNVDEIANVYGADRIYNLDKATEHGTAPQHLY